MTVYFLGFGVDWNIEKMVLIGRGHSPRYVTASLAHPSNAHYQITPSPPQFTDDKTLIPTLERGNE